MEPSNVYCIFTVWICKTLQVHCSIHKNENMTENINKAHLKGIHKAFKNQKVEVFREMMKNVTHERILKNIAQDIIDHWTTKEKIPYLEIILCKLGSFQSICICTYSTLQIRSDPELYGFLAKNGFDLCVFLPKCKSKEDMRELIYDNKLGIHISSKGGYKSARDIIRKEVRDILGRRGYFKNLREIRDELKIIKIQNCFRRYLALKTVYLKRCEPVNFFDEVHGKTRREMMKISPIWG